MSFSRELEIGDKISNSEISEIFKCSNQGGMRRSLKTGTLVIILDHTKGLYDDKWENGVLNYTGMGQVGDQVLDGNQNKTLFDSNSNGVEVHLFEVLKKLEYTYGGILKLDAKPYREKQRDTAGNLRMVWMFPLKPVSLQETNMNEFNIPEIRVIPMSSSEFENYDTYQDVQNNFFLGELITRERCAYNYREKGLRSYNNALLLFQYNNMIIASARLDEVVTFDNVVDSEYKGAFYLYTDSIQVFEPITVKDFQTVCPNFIGFSQTKQNIDIKCIYAILKLIELKSKNYEVSINAKKIFEDLADRETEKLSNGELLKRIINNKTSKINYSTVISSPNRDRNLKILVKRLAEGKCQLCKEDAPFEDKNKTPYLEEHHVEKLADGGLDGLGNVVALCPNCHRKVHILENDSDKTILKRMAMINKDKVSILN
jgi:hypothetical protein